MNRQQGQKDSINRKRISDIEDPKQDIIHREVLSEKSLAEQAAEDIMKRE